MIAERITQHRGASRMPPACVFFSVSMDAPDSLLAIINQGKRFFEEQPELILIQGDRLHTQLLQPARYGWIFSLAS